MEASSLYVLVSTSNYKFPSGLVNCMQVPGRLQNWLHPFLGGITSLENHTSSPCVFPCFSSALGTNLTNQSTGSDPEAHHSRSLMAKLLSSLSRSSKRPTAWRTGNLSGWFEPERSFVRHKKKKLQQKTWKSSHICIYIYIYMYIYIYIYIYT